MYIIFVSVQWDGSTRVGAGLGHPPNPATARHRQHVHVPVEGPVQQAGVETRVTAPLNTNREQTQTQSKPSTQEILQQDLGTGNRYVAMRSK